jgi:uncharacterized SAM-binding protein YcdF (DUF218 family)
MKLGIVLGGGITKRGKIPLNAKTRIRKALKLLKNNTIQKLILSGKAAYENPKKTEAKLFQEYLLKKGINKNRLILEEKSTDTITNALYSKKIVIKNKLSKEIILITSDYHMERSLMIFRHVFGEKYQITGKPSITLRLHRKLKFIEWEKKEFIKALFLPIHLGDHKKIEKIRR